MSTERPGGRTAARAVGWAFFSAAGAKAITLIGLTLLARLLAPRDFGLLAFALAYITYVETIGDLGSGMALVYWPDRREDAAQVTFLVNLAAGIFWCVATLVLAPSVATFFHSPNGEPIVRALALSFVIKFLGNTHDALAQKDLRFRSRVIPEFGLATLKASIAVVLAHFGFGAWSLVWGHLAGLTCWTTLLWIVVPWRPAFHFPRDLFRPMLRYGRGIIAVNVLSAVIHHVDLVIVGHYLGATTLGLYQMAQKIPETTVIILLWVVSKVLFPAFSRLHAAGENLRRPYLTATRYVSAITLPAAVGLAFLARPIVLLFFGPQWAGAAPILTALAIYAGLRSLSNHAGDVLKATGRAQLLAGISMIYAVIIVPALLLGAMRDAVTVAAMLAAVETVAAAITLTFASRVIGVPLSSIVKAFLPSVTASAALAVSLLAWLRWGPQNAVATVLGGVILGGLFYAGVLRLLDPAMFVWVKNNLLVRRAPSGDELLRQAARG